MELGPGPAERNEDLGCHQEDGHRGLQVELAPQEAEPEHHGDEADPEPGQHVHGEGGEEGHAQRAHGGGPHALGGGLDLPAPLRLAAEGTQGGQALDELQHTPGQRAESPPLPCGAPGRLPAERDHGHGDGQHQGDDDDEGQPVLRAHPGQEDERDDGGRGRLRQVAGVVGVQRAQSTGRGERELAGALPTEPARPERQCMAQQTAPQRRHHAVRRALGREVAHGVQRGAGEDRQPDHHDRRRHRAQRRVVQQ